MVTEGRDPLQAGRAGGRWDDGTFDALYTSTKRDGALAESWFHMTAGQPVPPSKPLKRIYEIKIDLDRVLDLSPAGRLEKLGVDMRSYGKLSYVQRASEYPTTQQIGEIAYFYQYEALLVPNARWKASNAVILTEHVDPARLTANQGERVDLAKWRTAQ